MTRLLIEPKTKRFFRVGLLGLLFFCTAGDAFCANEVSSTVAVVGQTPDLSELDAFDDQVVDSGSLELSDDQFAQLINNDELFTQWYQFVQELNLKSHEQRTLLSYFAQILLQGTPEQISLGVVEAQYFQNIYQALRLDLVSASKLVKSDPKAAKQVFYKLIGKIKGVTSKKGVTVTPGTKKLEVKFFTIVKKASYQRYLEYFKHARALPKNVLFLALSGLTLVAAKELYGLKKRVSDRVDTVFKTVGPVATRVNTFMEHLPLFATLNTPVMLDTSKTSLQLHADALNQAQEHIAKRVKGVSASSAAEVTRQAWADLGVAIELYLSAQNGMSAVVDASLSIAEVNAKMLELQASSGLLGNMLRGRAEQPPAAAGAPALPVAPGNPEYRELVPSRMIGDMGYKPSGRDIEVAARQKPASDRQVLQARVKSVQQSLLIEVLGTLKTHCMVQAKLMTPPVVVPPLPAVPVPVTTPAPAAPASAEPHAAPGSTPWFGGWWSSGRRAQRDDAEPTSPSSPRSDA